MADLEARNKNLFDKIVELARKGNLRLSDIRRHPDVLKLNNNKPVMFETVKNAIEKKLGKRTLNKIKNIPDTGKFKSETRKFVEDNIDKIKKDYLKGTSTTDLSKKYLNLDKSSTTLDTVLQENLTEAEKAKRPDIAGRNKFQQVMKDPKKLKAILEDIPKMANKEVLEKHKISSVTLNDIKNKYNLKFGKKLKKPIDPKVTDRLQKTVDAIESIELPEGQLDGNKTVIKNLAAKLNRTIPEFLGDVTRIRTQPDRFKISKQLTKNLGRFPDPKFFREALKAKGFGKRTIDTVTAVEKAAKQAVSSGSNLEHALPQSLIKEFNLPKKYLLTAERTSGFLNQFKKQFDNQLLKAAKEYSAGNISYPDYKKEVARISKIVSDKTGGYKIGYVDFVDGKAVPVTPQESLLKGEGDLGKKTKGLKNFFKNAVYHNTLFDNFNANPNDPSFATLRDEINKRPNQFIRENDAEKTAKAINNFTRPEQFYDFYKKNPDNIFFKALTRTASLAGGRGKMLLAGGFTLPFLATALAAGTPKEKGISTAEVMARKNAITEPTVSEPLKYDATVGSIVNATDDKKADQNQILEYVKDNPIKVAAGTSLGFAAEEIPRAYRTARGVGERGPLPKGRGRVRSALGISGALRPVLTTFGTPLVTGLYEGAIAGKRLDEGETMTDILTDPVGPALGVALMEPLSKLSGVVRNAPNRTMLEGAKNYFNLSNVGAARPGITGQILRMGLSPRTIAGASRFLGLPGVVLGAGLAGYDAYKNYQNKEGMIYNLFNKDE